MRLLAPLVVAAAAAGAGAMVTRGLAAARWRAMEGARGAGAYGAALAARDAAYKRGELQVGRVGLVGGGGGGRLRAAQHALLAQLPPDLWFNQTVDHDDATNNGTWQQRWWLNSTFWDGSGPVFFYVEGEGAGSPLDVVQGQHVELAAGYGALVVAFEHRGFGYSLPTPDQTVASLRVLTSDQQIGDIANFITSYLIPTFNLTAANPIISFGGSYPGALSAWLRLRLPHLIAGAFSSSSPVLADYDFTGYCDVVSASLSNAAIGGSPACLSAVTQAFAGIDSALRGTPAQAAALASQMYSCAPPVSTADIKLLASNLAGVIMGFVQYNNDPGVYAQNVADVCSIMTAPGADPLAAFASLVATQLPPGANCSDNSYADFIAQVGNTVNQPMNSGVGMRSWTWMTCIAFSYFQTCETGTACPFSTLMDLASQQQICQDAFSPTLTGAVTSARVNYTNAMFGGQAIGGSRILFVNGLVDPWHPLSVLPDANGNPANEGVLVPTGAHCRPMFPSSPNDPADVVAARAASAAILDGWLTK